MEVLTAEEHGQLEPLHVALLGLVVELEILFAEVSLEYAQLGAVLLLLLLLLGIILFFLLLLLQATTSQMLFHQYGIRLSSSHALSSFCTQRGHYWSIKVVLVLSLQDLGPVSQI